MAFVTFALPTSGPGRSCRFSRARTPTCSAEVPATGIVPAQVSRRAVLSGIALAALAVTVPEAKAAEEITTPSGLKYRVATKGKGPKINVGDLVAIRFRGTYNDVPFDDLFATAEPYFYRAGSDLVMKGIAEAVLLMDVGDTYELEVPANLAFGTKGRRASAGKPSIPPNATVKFTLLAESIPGKMEELIEVTGGEGLDE